MCQSRGPTRLLLKSMTSVISDRPLDGREDTRSYRCFIDNKKQVADILEECMDQFRGSADLTVRQATFSISEEFIRRIWKIKRKSGARFILAIDRKALQKTRLLWRFISGVYDEVYLADTHAKIILVSQEAPGRGVSGRTLSVITSQNLTRGNRYESTLVTSDRDIHDTLLKDFNNLTKFHSVPMHEIIPIQNQGLPASEIARNESDPESVTSQIEYYASIFMTISDIAVILEMRPQDLREAIDTPGSPEAKAYAKGKALAKAKIRAQEMQLAQLGSPLGVQNVRDNLIDMEADE